VRILTVLTYYRPHTSGLTIYAERLARALAERGHQVTVLTSRYDRSLPREETRDGVRIVRVPVWMRVSKGVVMPSIGLIATRELLRHDAMLLHLPQFDAAGLALRGRLLRRPTVITYHCDLLLPAGLLNRAVNGVVDLMNNVAALASDRVVAYTDDFANHSPFLRRFASKREVVLPPVELPVASPEAIRAFADVHKPPGFRTIGMATRFASEKGIEVLIDAMPAILEAHPRTKVLFAGQHDAVWAEERYRQRLMPRIEALRARGLWEFLGTLTPEQMAAFYPSLDALAVPSLNSTESFGLVQIEAMMNGVPVVASDLPGVRQPVAMTGMGAIVPIGDSKGLSQALLRVLDGGFTRTEELELARLFSPAACAAAYEELFSRLPRRSR
jgi:glycosyltransferase involved in cell wall biosynthesis